MDSINDGTNDILSKIRNYKLGEYYLFNLIAPFIVAYLISLFTSSYGIPRGQLFLLALPVSIVVYKLLSIPSTLAERFFDHKNYYILKISMLYLTYRGVTYKEI